MSQGWIKLHRQLFDNEIWGLEPFTKAQAWVDLLLLANHKDGSINVRGNILHIKRGQVGWSEVRLSSRWTWSRNKTRRFLKWLKTKQQIEQQKNTVSSIITIVNYGKYQGNDTTNDTADDTTERQQKDSRRYTNKNDKNKKNEKNIILEKFNLVLDKKYKSAESWEKNYKDWRKEFTLEEILEAIGNMPKHPWLKDKNFTPMKFFRRNQAWIEECQTVNLSPKLQERSKARQL